MKTGCTCRLCSSNWSGMEDIRDCMDHTVTQTLVSGRERLICAIALHGPMRWLSMLAVVTARGPGNRQRSCWYYGREAVGVASGTGDDPDAASRARVTSVASAALVG